MSKHQTLFHETLCVCGQMLAVTTEVKQEGDPPPMPEGVVVKQEEHSPAASDEPQRIGGGCSCGRVPASAPPQAVEEAIAQVAHEAIGSAAQAAYREVCADIAGPEFLAFRRGRQPATHMLAREAPTAKVELDAKIGKTAGRSQRAKHISQSHIRNLRRRNTVRSYHSKMGQGDDSLPGME